MLAVTLATSIANCSTRIYVHTSPIFLSSGVKEFISRFPQHINLPKDDGYSPLHLAALNDNGDVVTLLAQEVLLHVVIINIYTKHVQIEFSVGYIIDWYVCVYMLMLFDHDCALTARISYVYNSSNKLRDGN